MAAYGRGQMLGSGINPESFKQDYSGFANAAAIQAQGLSNLGQSIGGAIQDYGKMKQEQKKVDAMNKAASKAIESAITLGKSYQISGVEETLQPFLAAANDPSLSPIEKAALLDEGKAMIPNVFGRFDKNQAMLIEQAQNEAAAARAEATSNRGNRTRVIEKAVVNGVPVEFPVFVDPNNPQEAVYSDGSPVFPQSNTQSSNVPATAPSPAAGINSALKLTGNIKADANAINNATPLPADFIYTADGSPGSLPPVGTPAAGVGTSLLPPKPSDVAGPPAAPVLGNNAPQGTIRQLDRMPPGAVPIGEQEEGQIMTEKEVIELISKGFKISGRPVGDGKVFVTKQDSLTPQKGQEITYNPDGTVAVRDISLASDLNKAPTTSLKEGEALVPDPTSPTGTKVVQIPSEMREKAQTDFSTYIAQVGDSYAKLNEMGKAVSAGEANPLNYVFSTAAGQTMGRMFGEKGQPLRDQINTMAPNIINVIRQSTQMGSKGMDSNAEREFYIKAMGDPTLPIEANIKALEALDKAYGKGNAVENMLKNYPELAQKVNKYKLSPTTEETGTTGDFLTPTERALKDKYKPSK